MIDQFVYQPFPTRVVFGVGSIRRISRELDVLGVNRVLVFCSKSTAVLAEGVSSDLRERCAAILARSTPDLNRQQYAVLLADIKASGAGALVVVGGGTPIGIIKAVASNLKMPFVAIVTSYSGSEMSPNWYIGEGEDRIAGRDLAALPSTVIYDPNASLSLPTLVSAASGMNAMAHAVESLYGSDLNPIVEMQASTAITKLAESLPKIVANPHDIQARSEALFGAYLAAAFRAETGLHHALAQRIRQAFGLDHSSTHAVMLPYALSFNSSAAPGAVARIADALSAADAARGLYDLNVRLGHPTGLKDLGMPETGIERAVDVVMAARFANPRPAARRDVVEIVTQAFHGAPPLFSASN